MGISRCGSHRLCVWRMSDALWAIARTLLVMRKKERVLSLRVLLFIFDIFARYIGLPLFPYSGFYISCKEYIILWEPFPGWAGGSACQKSPRAFQAASDRHWSANLPVQRETRFWSWRNSSPWYLSSPPAKSCTWFSSSWLFHRLGF